MRDNCFHRAVIHLSNGGSSGQQEFCDDDPETLKKRVEEFINNLK